MSTEQWLLLTDYSSKYRISVSTLRRRIKNNQIPYRFDGGKYFIIDVSPTNPEVAAFQRETPIFPELKTFAAEPAPMRDQPLRPQTVPNNFAEQLNVDQGYTSRGGRFMQADEGAVQYNEPEESVPEFDFESGTAPMIAAYSSAQALRAAAPAENAAQEAFAGAYANAAEPLITTAKNLLNELKRAYTNILQEKEEQMIQLKREVSDLKTLARVLEDETDRLRRQLNHYQGRQSI